METRQEYIRKALETIGQASSGKLLQVCEKLVAIAKSDLRNLYHHENDFDTFLLSWFGNDPGIFWSVWEKVSGRGRDAVVWSRRPLRELLLLTADDVIEMGLLSGSQDEVTEKFQHMKKYFNVLLTAANDAEKVRLVRLLWLGREGVLSGISERWVSRSSNALRPHVGKELNQLRAYVEVELDERLKQIETVASEEAPERLDLSLPGVERRLGTRHLIRQTFEEIERIFLSLGYAVVEGPEIETPYYNFEALNIPEHHPARDMMDTFYLQAPPGLLLRTHTSPMQARTIERQPPPVRIVVPGKVYRRDNPDSTHSFMFHQVEVLAVDTDLTFCDFKGTVEYFVREFFGPRVKTRLRPSYFPFTEPSAEVDASCHVCGGSGCRTCKFAGWIELFGAGMVDPAVYGFVKNMGYDPKRISGFAWGIGVDRFALLKYGIDDLQLFFQNDVRFLRQFP